MTTPGYSMATNNDSVMLTSYSTVTPSFSAMSSSTQVYQTVTPASTTAAATSSVIVVPTESPSTIATGGYVASVYKRDAITVNIKIPVAQSLVSTNLKTAIALKTSSKPTPSMLVPNTNAPEPTSAPETKSSSKPSVADEVKTIVVSQGPRCPYPYPGIHCGKPITTVTTVKKATPTSMQSIKKASEDAVALETTSSALPALDSAKGFCDGGIWAGCK
ncbi:uncharacterized protein N0V89_012245 [Didymosphaeria variabile]|uniref:Uncharacterized protein n=1 Tax=Didymosphaeria variabile TaxID=1932322 RepID=A0A9W9C4U7_9PLEO|nr:uncharacterized protein N0V89_012245 [Didymosphaeria variabile]KAJ4344502.1 hypothetical protein N0V89_012245 [Didymosphaeria variabile]